MPSWQQGIPTLFERRFKWVNRVLFFICFRSFQKQILQKKLVGVSQIRTRIIRVEGKQTDRFTTTAQTFAIVKKLVRLYDKNNFSLISKRPSLLDLA